MVYFVSMIELLAPILFRSFAKTWGRYVATNLGDCSRDWVDSAGPQGSEEGHADTKEP